MYRLKGQTSKSVLFLYVVASLLLLRALGGL
jgi:hypothetical protein